VPLALNPTAPLHRHQGRPAQPGLLLVDFTGAVRERAGACATLPIPRRLLAEIARG
jgi:hypothetical protein